MKKLFLMFLATVLVFCAAFAVTSDADGLLATAYASDDVWISGMCGDNVKWEMDSHHVLTFSGSGDMYDYDAYDTPWHGYGVVKVVIGPDVTSLTSYAFAGNGMLEEIEFAENGNLRKIGDGAFRGVFLEEYNIPASVEEIGAGAFSGCHSLKKINFPENSKLKFIDDGAFHYLEGLESIEIPAGVEIIGNEAFKSCWALKTVTFRENSSLKELGDSAFEDCNSLESINLPLTVEKIGEAAFNSCDVLKEISLGSKLEKISASTFFYCFELEKVNVPEDSRITRIEDEAFCGCEKLYEFNMPEGVTYFGQGAFDGCLSLVVGIPEGLVFVGDGALERTANTEINIPETVTYFGGMLCPNVKKYTVDPDNQYYCSDEAGALFNKDKTLFISYPASAEATEYAIPEGVTEIFSGAFFLNLNLEKIIIPDGVTKIGDSVFTIALSLEELIIPEGVETIGETAFHACAKLKRLVLPSTLKELGYGSFLEACGLERVEIYSKDFVLNEEDYLGLVFEPFISEDGTTFCYGECLSDYYYCIYTGDFEYIDEKYGSYEKFTEILLGFDANGLVPSEACMVYCYEGAAIEDYLKANNVNYKYFCDHVEEEIPAVAPTCTETGLTAGVKCSVCDDILVEQETVGKTRHITDEPVKENEVKATCKIAAYHEDVYYCVDCGAETLRVFVTGEVLPHAEEEIPAVAPTCTEAGLTAGVKCSVCGDVLVAQQTVGEKGHSPVVVGAIEPDTDMPGYTGDTICSECDELLVSGEEIPALEGEETIECDHICHKSGFMGFIWKMLNFFQKLFRVEPVCKCGAAHY